MKFHIIAPFFEIHTELIKKCFELFNFFKILKASSLDLGLLINSLLREITLSAPKTNLSGFLLLTFIDLISAKFLEIFNGSAPAANRNFTSSSSTLDTIISQSILCSSKIFFCSF